jgi:molybdopterin converting factor small subunit
MRYTVELFGMTNALAGIRKIEVDLDGEVRLQELIHALRRAQPELEGRVVEPDEDKLTRHYAFNVNGRFHIDDMDTSVRPEDRIVLLTLALGG